MNQIEVMAALEEHGALRTGHFKLSSGLHSDTYVQCAAALQWPGLAERFGHDLGERFADAHIEAVLGPAMGGLIIGHETARKLGVRHVFCERMDGQMMLRRGFRFERGERVLVVEDVVTTGKSQREAIDVVRAGGADPVGVAAIIDRSKDVAFGVPFEALARVDAHAWKPDECPLCAAGGEPEAPGSRHLPG